MDREHLPIVKQELTENIWLWKYTYCAVIVVKPVKVCHFLCLGVLQSNNFGLFATV